MVIYAKNQYKEVKMKQISQKQEMHVPFRYLKQLWQSWKLESVQQLQGRRQGPDRTGIFTELKDLDLLKGIPKVKRLATILC